MCQVWFRKRGAAVENSDIHCLLESVWFDLSCCTHNLVFVWLKRILGALQITGQCLVRIPENGPARWSGADSSALQIFAWWSSTALPWWHCPSSVSSDAGPAAKMSEKIGKTSSRNIIKYKRSNSWEFLNKLQSTKRRPTRKMLKFSYTKTAQIGSGLTICKSPTFGASWGTSAGKGEQGMVRCGARNFGIHGNTINMNDIESLKKSKKNCNLIHLQIDTIASATNNGAIWIICGRWGGLSSWGDRTPNQPSNSQGRFSMATFWFIHDPDCSKSWFFDSDVLWLSWTEIQVSWFECI